MFKKKQTTEVLIAEIHNEFNTAGEKLLLSAQKILNQVGQHNIEKAERLKNAGFSNSQDVRTLIPVKVTQETVDLIHGYLMRYPLNKFITKDQVIQICKKYNLVTVPTSKYKGFVPETKLKDVENFHVHDMDLPDFLIRIKAAWNTPNPESFVIRSRGADWIHKKFGELIPSSHPALKWHGDALFGVYYEGKRGRQIAYVEKFDLIETREMQICCPEKDAEISGLKKIGSFFHSVTTVHVPDPVVLQPVKGGYLIVTAWGDEASDPIVVNPVNN